MPKDYFNVNVSHVSLGFDFDETEAVHSVGLSHLKGYLTIMFGEEVPHEETDRILADRALAALAMLSTDEQLGEVLKNNPLKYVPFWLRRFEPVIDTTKTLGRRIDGQLDECEKAKKARKNLISNDLTYLNGIFDVSSFIIASQLELEHPRNRATRLISRSKGVMPVGHTFLSLEKPELSAFEFLTRLPLIKAEYRRKMARLRILGQKIVDASETHIERLRVLAEGMEA